ncbi:HET-domain-containing protein, partial [Aulographum hederae CBS 113979]
YKYLDPSRQEIRLLILAPGTADEPVRGTLRHVGLLEDPYPAYETVSYVWGDPTNRRAILLDGQERMVPASSKEVLRRMRYPDRERVLWIDAICINQEHPEERGRQVAMMRLIYSSAVTNLIWLGEDEGTTGTAVESIQAIYDEVRTETNNFSDFTFTICDRQGRRQFSDTGLTTTAYDPSALLTYFSSSWFTRVWVVQEAALAPKSIFYRGDHATPLEDVLRVASWLFYKQRFLPWTTNHTGLNNAAILSNSADDECGIDNVRNRLLPDMRIFILGFLDSLQDFGAYELKDHVYGLLGLFQKFARTKDLPPGLTPDYVCSLGTTLARASRFATEERGDLEMLRFVSHLPSDGQGEGEAHIPSWVPYWHRRTDVPGEPAGLEILSHKQFFKADEGRGMQLSAEDPERPTVLSLRGFQFQTVKSVAPVVMGKSWESVKEMKELMTVLDGFFDENMVVGDGQNEDEIRGATLTFELDWSSWSRLSRPDAAVRYRAFASYLAETADERLPEPGEGANEAVADFQSAMRNAVRNRRVFVTAEGKAGVGPQMMREGDAVVVLFGCRWPVVLREVEGGWEMVGLGYVFGEMDGEAV